MRFGGRVTTATRLGVEAASGFLEFPAKKTAKKSRLLPRRTARFCGAFQFGQGLYIPAQAQLAQLCSSTPAAHAGRRKRGQALALGRYPPVARLTRLHARPVLVLSGPTAGPRLRPGPHGWHAAAGRRPGNSASADSRSHLAFLAQ